MDGPKARIVRYMSHESELETVQEPSGSTTGPNTGQGESVAQPQLLSNPLFEKKVWRRKHLKEIDECRNSTPTSIVSCQVNIADNIYEQ